jgi:hypothetical protein
MAVRWERTGLLGLILGSNGQAVCQCEVELELEVRVDEGRRRASSWGGGVL